MKRLSERLKENWLNDAMVDDLDVEITDVGGAVAGATRNPNDVAPEDIARLSQGR